MLTIRKHLQQPLYSRLPIKFCEENDQLCINGTFGNKIATLLNLESESVLGHRDTIQMTCKLF